jgi:hypothetical protein
MRDEQQAGPRKGGPKGGPEYVFEDVSPKKDERSATDSSVSYKKVR